VLLTLPRVSANYSLMAMRLDIILPCDAVPVKREGAPQRKPQARFRYSANAPTDQLMDVTVEAPPNRNRRESWDWKRYWAGSASTSSP
jgi:hypothetical protein